MYWSIGSFPELQHLEQRDRERILKSCRSRTAMARMLLYAFSLSSFFSMMSTAAVLAANHTSPWAIFSQRWPKALFAASYLLWMAVLYQYQLIRVRGQLRLYLEKEARRQKLPLCLNCGYNVEGLQSHRCPECGAIWDHRTAGEHETG